MKKLIFVLLLMCSLFILGCSSDKKEESTSKETDKVKVPAKATRAGNTVDTAPGAQGGITASIVPLEASYGDVLTLTVSGVKIDEAQHVAWMHNGSPVSTLRRAALDSRALGVKKGDTIQVEIVAYDGSNAKSNVVVFRNSLPELEYVKIMPEVFGPNDMVYVEAHAQDRDSDNVTISYQWTKNGAPVSTSSSLEQPLRKGDTFSVRLVPFDGEAYGQDISISHTVGNVPPQLQQHFDFTFDGTLYVYQAKADDPDGDVITYGLRSAPAGMSIDSSSGQIKWNVPLEFTGQAIFFITASDNSGGKAEMEMHFNIK
jgi:hypothetical protein